jgi:hypothetical protein
MSRQTPAIDNPQSAPGAPGRNLPAEALAKAGPQSAPRVRVLDVEYAHVRLPGGDDLYLTEFGLPLAEQLMPENYWTDKDWFRGHSERLSGTSTLYRIATRPVAGRRGLSIVLKWNRVGQDVPGSTEADDLTTAEFNSPFEEFALAIEMRETRYESPGVLYTHKPLAIYVPAQKADLDRLGRKEHRMAAKQDAHKGFQLDPRRNYAVIYEWIKGIDATEALRIGALDKQAQAELVERARQDMLRKGFIVRDCKPQHVIVRPDGNGGLVRGRGGGVLYASVDFELLERTAEREQHVRSLKRKAYLVRQARRFEAREAFPPHLAPVRIFGVDYVYGHIESTGGALWVVGKDPELFDYFLPEKWRKTPRTRLSLTNQVYDTITKDNIHLVWRVSRIGEQPDMDPFNDHEKRILEYGYNSPFEEVALAMELTARGIETIYPRAIYMTGEAAKLPAALSDERRFENHAHLVMPDGRFALEPDHDYIIIWGYWNGPDELLAVKDENYYTGVNALSAYRDGLIEQDIYLQLMQATRDRLTALGVEDLNLRGNHLILSIDKQGRMLEDPATHLPAVRICNFEMLRKVP